jgi:hypothetical protein
MGARMIAKCLANPLPRFRAIEHRRPASRRLHTEHTRKLPAGNVFGVQEVNCRRYQLDALRFDHRDVTFQMLPHLETDEVPAVSPDGLLFDHFKSLTIEHRSGS